MILTLYLYGELKLSGNEDDHYINRVEEDIKDMKYEKDKEDEDVEIIEPLNQFITRFTLEFKYASEYTRYMSNDQFMRHMYLG